MVLCKERLVLLGVLQHDISQAQMFSFKVLSACHRSATTCPEACAGEKQYLAQASINWRRFSNAAERL